MTFSQSHGAAYTFLLFYSFKLKLAVVGRELNSVSSDRNGRTRCHFVRSNIFKNKMSQNFWYTRYTGQQPRS
jgi:hypothetical protein